MTDLVATLDLTKLRETAERATWRGGETIPPVARGGMNEFVVAVYREHSQKVYSFAASYLNAYPLEYRDGCPNKQCDGDGCDDGCPTTGWFIQVGDDDYEFLFNNIDLSDGDKLLGWREIPRWEDRNPTILALIEHVEKLTAALLLADEWLKHAAPKCCEAFTSDYKVIRTALSPATTDEVP